ncbi:MAG: hypothetical protein BZY80_06040 [SAR202 cluster bacterium Io17-Chloro-G2]|nr:MAG: hypothetical protein BZY80_06040 [SAR202 cluster bacterium Io17-Chloro-G2]
MTEKTKSSPHVSGASQSQLIENARELAPRLAERAPTAEAERRLPVETVQDLHRAGLLAMNIPLDQGGTEAELDTQLAVYEIIGGACASTAWVLGNHLVLCARIQGMMGDGAQPHIKDVAENGSVIAHAAVPGGTTRKADGGFVTGGRWPFVSGANVAGLIVLSTMVPGPPPGWQPPAGGTKNSADPPAAHNRWLLVAPDNTGLRIEETWRAMSLRASMSNDVVADEVFVLEELSPVDNRPPPYRPWLPEGPAALRVPLRARVWMSGMMLGIALAALDDTLEFAMGRKMSIGGQPRTNMPGNQFAVADAAMEIESARAFLYQEVRAIMAKAQAGIEFQAMDATRMEMAGLVARENAIKAVDKLFTIRGANGLFETGNFERYYRDVRVGTLHAATSPNLTREQVGKSLFGVPADVQPRWG